LALIFNGSDRSELNPIDGVGYIKKVSIENGGRKNKGFIESIKEKREIERIHGGELIMGKRIGEILRIDMINIIIIIGPFKEEFIAMKGIADKNIEARKPLIEEIDRARESGKERRK